jgi:hypothetical protein
VKGPSTTARATYEGVLDVVNTFIRSSKLDSSPRQLKSRLTSNTPAGVGKANLNRNLCLLLHHLGVPLEMFEELLQIEVNNVLISNQDRKAAIRLASKYVKTHAQQRSYGRHARTDSDSDTDADSDEDDTDDDSSAVLYPSSRYPGGGNNDKSSHTDGRDLSDRFAAGCNISTDTASKSPLHQASGEPMVPFPRVEQTQAERASEFLLSGHSLSEPWLKQALARMQAESLRQLQKCRIPFDNSIYLVGVPDPYGILRPGEVFILLPLSTSDPGYCNRDSNSSERDCDSTCSVHSRVESRVVTGSVLVTRNPLMHPGDIRKLFAVNYSKLCALFAHTVGGVILFSVQGDQAEAQNMSGGDYDGDLYLVIHGQASIIQHVQTVAPAAPDTVGFEDDIVNHNSASAAGPNRSSTAAASGDDGADDEQGWTVFQGG